MVSMGFLEPSTGRAALWRAEGSAIQFTGEENCGGVSRSSDMPPRVHSSRKPVESMPAHLFFIPSPSAVRRGGEGSTETTILRLVAIDYAATAEREREGGLLLPSTDYGERERDCERGCRMQQRWLRARCSERLRRRELLWSESNGPQGRGI